MLIIGHGHCPEVNGNITRMSIEGAKKLSCLLAKSISGLPYSIKKIRFV
jgi:hypothetical protein